MADLINFVLHEWAVVMNAPGTFVTLCVLIGSAMFIVVRWHYEGSIRTLSEHIRVLQERMEAKDDQLAEYRERLHLIPISGTSYSRLTNEELKTRTFALVGNIRQLVQEFDDESNKTMYSHHSAMIQVITIEERHRLWEAFTQSSHESYNKLDRAYEERFKTDTILLRDELHARLPKESTVPPPDDHWTNTWGPARYELPMNPNGMIAVADDLEKLAKKLV